MLKKSTVIRVRYAETDRMGYVYYGNYAAYFEVARVELLRAAGITYRSLEDEGILLPVISYEIKFLLPALYDDELMVVSTIPEAPTARIRFQYETRRDGELLNTASTDLAFVSRSGGRPMRCPPHVLEALLRAWS
ncbi:MAG: acyl-CoA thioesterase [Flavobacteriales bacterium]|jgi:acyl-CoA thioester hydrolase